MCVCVYVCCVCVWGGGECACALHLSLISISRYCLPLHLSFNLSRPRSHSHAVLKVTLSLSIYLPLSLSLSLPTLYALLFNSLMIKAPTSSSCKCSSAPSTSALSACRQKGRPGESESCAHVGRQMERQTGNQTALRHLHMDG